MEILFFTNNNFPLSLAISESQAIFDTAYRSSGNCEVEVGYGVQRPSAGRGFLYESPGVCNTLLILIFRTALMKIFFHHSNTVG